MGDQKDINRYDGQSGENDDNSPEKASVFKHLGTSDRNFIFQYKKTEKILAALYLVTNFLSTQEPLRWQLRDLGLALLSNVMSLKDALPSQKEELCNSIKTAIFEMISLLEISFFAGFISQMNFDVLKKEFYVLMDSVSQTKHSLESFVLPNNFFTEPIGEIPPVASSMPSYIERSDAPSKASKTPQQKPAYKGQNTAGHDTEHKKTSHGLVEIKKNSRQNVILNLLKKKKEIMIKDISAIIKDCSEKTLQRELLAMVEQGILKKEGERRWSRYSLA